ncbi:hypothetical protein V8E54_002658 [Elaphomyces granulatus]
MTAFIHSHSSAQFTSSYNLYLTAASTSANAATSVTTDDNGNELEEEGGDGFVEIDDQRATAAVELATAATADGCYDSRYDSHYDSYCNGRYNGQDGCCDGSSDCSYDSTTKARLPEGLKGQRAQEEEAEGYWWW